MSRDEARKPWASMLDPLPKYTPLVLTRNTWPLAERLPKMLVGDPPITLLSTTEEVEGCRNWTYWPCPMLNCCQLMMALWLAWWITRLFAFWAVILACPATTCPPLGFASASIGVKAPIPSPTWAPRFSSVFTLAFRGWLERVRYDMVCSFRKTGQQKIGRWNAKTPA